MEDLSLEQKNNSQIIGLKLVGWQKYAAKVFEELQNDDILVIKASRQKGKSTLMCQMMLYVSLNNSRAQSYFISPTNNQCRKQFNDMKDMCVESPLVVKLNESTQEIHFYNGSTIYFRSAESGDNLRGNTVKNGGILVIDEMAFIKSDTIAILLPYVTVSHANIVCVSTPRRQNGMFYEWYIKAKSSENNFKFVDVNDFDNSFFISEDQKKMYKNILSAEKYKNEILGEFTTMDEGVFGEYSSHLSIPEDNEVVYAGIDWSSTGSDYTVISGFNIKKEQCFLWKDRDLDPLKRCEKIAEILNSFKSLKAVKIEYNSIGAVYSSMLKRLCNKPLLIKDFVTSNTSKRNIIENFIRLLGQGEITLLPDEEQQYQMSIYVQQPLSNGGYTYNADPAAQNSHDDIIMATAMAIDSFAQPTGSYSLGSSTFNKPRYKLKQRN